MALSKLERDELIPFSDKQYIKTQWMDGNRPAINAENLLKIESSLYDLYKYLCTGADGSGKYYQNLIKISTTINELVDSLNSEISTRDSQTTALSGRIDGEINRAITAEDDIQREIGDETDSAGHTVNINNKIIPTIHGRIAKICEDLIELINEEQNRALGAEATLKASLGKEATDRATADQTLSDNLTLGYKTYTDNVASSIVSKIGDDSSNDANTVYGKMNLHRAELANAISDESYRAIEAERLLSNSIINETTRATTEESSLKALINGKESSLKELISKETNRATSRENSIEDAFEESLQELSERVDANSELIAMSDATAVATEVITLRLKSQEIENRIGSLTLFDLNDTDSELEDVTILDGGTVSKS